MKFLAALWLAALACAAVAQPRYTLDTTPTVLPKTVIPSRVNLRLDLDPAKDTFSGEATIFVRVRTRVDAIVLHAKALQPGELRLLDRRKERALAIAASTVPDTWRLVPQDGKPIEPGPYRLQLAWRGVVGTSGEALYNASYMVKGQRERLLSSQLESLYARRVMPAFDEPVFRVRFQLEVRAPRGLTALSNMPRIETRTDGDAEVHRFALSPPMQSYLFAVTVGRFDVLEDSVEGIPLRIFTAHGKRELARDAMRVTRELLPYYRQYFGRAFALPKLDQVAIPTGRGGAMEDWGLISYAEGFLLFDPVKEDAAAQQRNFIVIAHEIAHQWFGNLVSPATWGDIWLNESFANWMESKAAQHFHPEWGRPLHVRRGLEGTLERDATTATRAIRSLSVTEETVDDLFDNIGYEKGSAVLAMLEQWLGEEEFRRGMVSYMAERAMKPATAGDLWHHMALATGKPVAKVASSWTDQPGFPLVSVSARCEGGTTIATLRQERFSVLGETGASTWSVPVRLARGDKLVTELLETPEKEVRLAGCTDEPLLANAGGQGFYRVAHDERLAAKLASSFPQLRPADRVALLSDSFALAAAGRRSLAGHIQLLAALPTVHDSSRAAMYLMAAAQIQHLQLAFEGTKAEGALESAGQALLAPELARLGWEPRKGESNDESQLRATLVRRLASLNHAPTIAEARRLFAAAIAADVQRVPPSMRSSVLYAVGRHATTAEFDAMLEGLRTTENQFERFMYINALAAGRDPVLVRRFLEESLSGRLPPDISGVLPTFAGNLPATSPIAYRFVLENWEALSRIAGTGGFTGTAWLLPRIAQWSSEADVADRLVADQARLVGIAGAANAQRSAATIRLRHQLKVREMEGLPAALQPLLAGQNGN